MRAFRNFIRVVVIVAALLGAFSLISVSPGYAQTDDTEERGAYLAMIAGCQNCHSPQDGPAFSGGLVQRHSREVFAPNLTPAQSGLGNWSDAQIRAAITTGLRPDGRQLDPVMPYLFYNAMADSDLSALISYLRGLDPVETAPVPLPELSGVVMPPLPDPQTGISVPDRSDAVAYGGYLVEAVLACGSCHTPLMADGRPDNARGLAGGQAFSGAWGTVYAANLTPDRTSGLLPSMEEEVVLAVVAGRHPEGRPIYAMPWESYSVLSGSDAQAIVTYLYSLDPVTSDIPPAQLNPGFEQYPPDQRPQPSLGNILTTVLLAVLLGGLVIYTIVRQYRQAQRIREIDWVGEFNEALAQTGKRAEKAEEDSPDPARPEPPQE